MALRLLRCPKSSSDSSPYRVQLHRRMRSGETHYVDHPRLGILIRSERVAVADGSGEPEMQTETPAVPPAEAAMPEQETQPEPSSLPRAMPDPT